MKELGIKVDSVRLDRYYSFKSIVEYFDDNTEMYIIPKKNISSLRYSGERFRRVLRKFIVSPYEYVG